MTKSLIDLAKQLFPITIRRKFTKLTSYPPVGCVNFGSFRRLTPISSSWGFERGQPIDRYYIENFLSQHSEDIHGRVLEIGDNTYTKKYGRNKVTESDVLHILEKKPNVTIIANLESAAEIPSDSFDCILLTQTLQFIFDIKAALRTIHRILKPGGVVLVTTPGTCQISRYDMDRWGDYWRLTTKSAQTLFECNFLKENIQVKAYGNVLVSTSLLYGLAAGELRKEELDFFDPDYEMLVAVRAEKIDSVDKVHK